MKLNKNKLIHIVGVGGIGMSGIAEILSEMGYQVQGSDIKINANIVRLNKKKIKTFNSHKQSNLKNVSLVVYSSAISKNNIELEYSKKKIMDKMNFFFQNQVVERIKFKSFNDEKSDKKENEPQSYGTKNRFEKNLTNVENESLKKSLIELTKVFKTK